MDSGRLSSSARGALYYMTGSALAFSLMSLFVKAAGTRLPSQEIVVVRAMISLVLSAAILARQRISFRGNRPGLLVVRGLLGFGGLSCFFFAVTRLPLGAVTVLHYLHPIFTAVLAAFFLRERADSRLVAALILSLGGVFAISRPAFLFGSEPGAAGLDPAGVAVAVVGALFSAGAYVTVRKLSATENPHVIVFYFPLVAVPLSLPALAADAVFPTPLEWAFLAAVGIFTQIGQVMMTHGLRVESAGRAGAIAYVQVAFAALWGVLFFGERPRISSAIGAALILAGTLVVARKPSAAPPDDGTT